MVCFLVFVCSVLFYWIPAVNNILPLANMLAYSINRHEYEGSSNWVRTYYTPIIIDWDYSTATANIITY